MQGKTIKGCVIAFWGCVLLALLMPFLLIGVPQKPPSETAIEWIQRSGSLIVVFALLAEFHSIKLQKIMYSPGEIDQQVHELPKFYIFTARISDSLAICLAIIGSVVWGYLDVIIK